MRANSQIQSFGSELQDFSDTALVSEMDLVISVCTSVAHLAGALNRPLWVLLSHACDWRWLLDRDNRPGIPARGYSGSPRSEIGGASSSRWRTSCGRAPAARAWRELNHRHEHSRAHPPAGLEKSAGGGIVRARQHARHHELRAARTFDQQRLQARAIPGPGPGTRRRPLYIGTRSFTQSCCWRSCASASSRCPAATPSCRRSRCRSLDHRQPFPLPGQARLISQMPIGSRAMARSPEIDIRRSNPDDICQIVLTSGTRAMPKPFRSPIR